MSEMTASDIALLNGNGGMNNWMNNPFIYLVFLRLWGNGGWGNGYEAAAASGALTRAELTDGLNFQSLDSAVRDVRDAVAGVGSTVQSVGAGLSDKMCCGFNGVNSAIANNTYQDQLGFCSINRNIDSVRYENSQNTCAITTAIHEDGEKTRALMVQQQIQDLRDRNAALNNELQSAQLTLANASQTQNILGSLGHFVPYAGCGYSCGCNAW